MGYICLRPSLDQKSGRCSISGASHRHRDARPADFGNRVLVGNQLLHWQTQAYCEARPQGEVGLMRIEMLKIIKLLINDL